MRRPGDILDWLTDHPTFEVWPISTTAYPVHPHEADGEYVERFWLPIIGPSALLALRRLATTPAGVTVNLVDLGASLGIGTGTGRNTTINRTLARLADFDMIRVATNRVADSGPALLVRRWLPTVPNRMLRRLPPALHDDHHIYTGAST